MMKLPGGRWVALQALGFCREEGLMAPDALEKAWTEAGVGQQAQSGRDWGRERGLSMGLVQGVLRWELRLDAIIARLSHKKGHRQMHPTVRSILQIGLYQLIFMDRMPARAAVSETVALTRPAKVHFATGFVNGGLRRFLREKEKLYTPEGKGHDYLAEAYSHPVWMVRKMYPSLKDELEAYLQSNQALPPVTLRVNRVMSPDPDVVLDGLSEEDFPFEKSSYVPGAFTLTEKMGRPDTLPGFADGLITVQDIGSQLMPHLLGVEPGQRVLDACAAPGGKTAQLAELMENTGTLYAVDVSPRRLKTMSRGLERLGVDEFVQIRQKGWTISDAPANLMGSFSALGPDEALDLDGILVDAPCTAWGVVRRHPEIKSRRTHEDVRRMAELQFNILEAQLPHLKAGGVIVYSVCSPLRDEGEGVIARFIRAHPEFVIEPPIEGGPVDFSPFLQEDGSIRAWPHRHGSDAFYGVRLRHSSN